MHQRRGQSSRSIGHFLRFILVLVYRSLDALHVKCASRHVSDWVPYTSNRCSWTSTTAFQLRNNLYGQLSKSSRKVNCIQKLYPEFHPGRNLDYGHFFHRFYWTMSRRKKSANICKRYSKDVVP